MRHALVSEGENIKTREIPTTNPGGSCSECVAPSLGLCQVDGKCTCYGKKVERLRPQLLQYNFFQGCLWKHMPTDILIKWLHNFYSLGKGKRPNIMRFSVYGEFPNQERVDKFITVANAMPRILFYGYTTRYDLDWSARPGHMTVNGSAWMMDNMFLAVPKRKVKWYMNHDYPICPGNCMTCGGSIGQGFCMKRTGSTIIVPYH